MTVKELVDILSALRDDHCAGVEPIYVEGREGKRVTKVSLVFTAEDTYPTVKLHIEE